DVITTNGIIYTLIAILVGTIFAFFMAKGMTQSLQHLVNVADSVREGARNVRSDIKRSDEIGRLSEDFNAMLETVLNSEYEAWLAKEQLAESEERFNLAMQGSNDGIWDWDINTGQVYYSPRWCEMLGYQPGEVSSDLSSWENAVHPDDLVKANDDIQAHLDGETSYYENVQRIKHKNGTYRWHLERGIAVRNENGEPYRMVGVTTDFTDRKIAEDALFDEKEKALVTLHSIGDGVITTDKQSRIEFMNPVAENLTGWTLRDAAGKDVSDILNIINERTNQAVDNPVKRCLKEQTVIELSSNSILISRDGKEIAIEDSAAPIRDREGNIIGTVMVFHDVGVTRELSRKMTWQATHDSLTGLINRSEFEIRLSQMIHNAQMDDTSHVLLYLDLDQFKVVNDTCGHSAGDELLKQLSFLLHEEIRESDTLARLGGDEFGVLLESCNIEKAEQIAEKLRRVVNDFQFIWQDKTFDVGVSIGITSITHESENLSKVLSEADVACYAAKDLGRNRLHVYTIDDEELSLRHSEMQWVSRITKALEEDRFVLFGQAIKSINATSENTIHREILVRMKDENGEIVPPYSFIPSAERFNLMPSIDKWVIKNSFKYLSDKGDQQEYLSINLSGNSLSDETLLDYIRDNLKTFNIEPQRICFEITETTAISHLSRAVILMRELKQDGCTFSLDDFGSGLSSFAYLKNMPVDYLKIDGGFVKDIVDDPIDRAMVSAINQVGQIMGIKTIAEFVENDEILSALKVINVDYVQGYGIEKPMPLNT
ncbi:MAG: EAL domain-containing protein, partial [Thioalkalispiraceae bacterium]